MSEVITIDQIRDLIKAEKIKPSDIFGVESLTDDPAVVGYVEAEKRKAVSGEYAHRKRDEEGFDKTKGELESQLKAKDEEIQKLKVVSVKNTIPTLFQKQKEDRKLSDMQSKWIEKRLEKFTPENPENLEKELNAYLDNEIDEYKVVAKDVFGIEDKDNGKDKGKTGGTEPNEGGSEDTGDENKYTDPTQNPLIKTD